MRYTTIIDVSELPAVYRNRHALLIYVYMALKCGYHDDDRDRIAISIRNLAWATGNTVSATRHALRMLQDNGLLKRDGDSWIVKKWCAVAPPTPRTKATTAKYGSEDSKLGQKLDQQVNEYQQKVLQAIRDCTREELVEWLHELEEGYSRRHKGVSIASNRATTEWFRNLLKSM